MTPQSLTIEIAHALGLDSNQTAAIGLAARLHDIGKMSFRAAPFDPDAPDREAATRDHPARGADYVRLAAGDQVAACIRSHHERWDGQGYPDGLSGEKIPTGARIIGIVDAFDALGLFSVFSTPWFLLLMTVLTNIVSNNAAAAIGTPIAVSIANQLGVPSEPFILAVLFGANMSFATPYGYQTNLLVMTAGGYKFQDFMRVGIPLTVIMWIGFSIVLPLLYEL